MDGHGHRWGDHMRAQWAIHAVAGLGWVTRAIGIDHLHAHDRANHLGLLGLDQRRSHRSPDEQREPHQHEAGEQMGVAQGLHGLDYRIAAGDDLAAPGGALRSSQGASGDARIGNVQTAQRHGLTGALCHGVFDLHHLSHDGHRDLGGCFGPQIQAHGAMQTGQC